MGNKCSSSEKWEDKPRRAMPQLLTLHMTAPIEATLELPSSETVHALLTQARMKVQQDPAGSSLMACTCLAVSCEHRKLQLRVLGFLVADHAQTLETVGMRHGSQFALEEERTQASLQSPPLFREAQMVCKVVSGGKGEIMQNHAF